MKTNDFRSKVMRAAGLADSIHDENDVLEIIWALKNTQPLKHVRLVPWSEVQPGDLALVPATYTLYEARRPAPGSFHRVLSVKDDTAFYILNWYHWAEKDGPLGRMCLGGGLPCSHLGGNYWAFCRDVSTRFAELRMANVPLDELLRVELERRNDLSEPTSHDPVKDLTLAFSWGATPQGWDFWVDWYEHFQQSD